MQELRVLSGLKTHLQQQKVKSIGKRNWMSDPEVAKEVKREERRGHVPATSPISGTFSPQENSPVNLVADQRIQTYIPPHHPPALPVILQD